MSKGAIWPAAQNPLAATSNPVSSDVIVAPCSNCLLFSFCNVGSMGISWRTSFSRLVVVFPSLLWRSVINHPSLHVRACSMLKLFPHVHVLGVRDNSNPYLILTMFQNSCLLSMYPSSSIGKVDSHAEEPYSVLTLFSLHCWLVSFDLISINFCWLYSCLSCLIFFLMLFIVSFWIPKSPFLSSYWWYMLFCY